MFLVKRALIIGLIVMLKISPAAGVEYVVKLAQLPAIEGGIGGTKSFQLGNAILFAPKVGFGSFAVNGEQAWARSKRPPKNPRIADSKSYVEKQAAALAEELKEPTEKGLLTDGQVKEIQNYFTSQLFAVYTIDEVDKKIADVIADQQKQIDVQLAAFAATVTKNGESLKALDAKFVDDAKNHATDLAAIHASVKTLPLVAVKEQLASVISSRVEAQVTTHLQRIDSENAQLREDIEALTKQLNDLKDQIAKPSTTK